MKRNNAGWWLGAGAWGGWAGLAGALLFGCAVFLLLSHKDYSISGQWAAIFSLALVGGAWAALGRRGRDGLFFWLGLAGALAAVAVICLPLTRASWAVADDYIIPMMLGDSGHMTFQEFLAHCRKVDSLSVVVGNTSGRFQPFFVLSYAVNAFLWGNAIELWYVLYGLLFLAAVVLAFLSLRQFFDGVTAVLSGCLVLTVLQWHWLFRDTGVVEVYALFWLTLMAYLLARSWNRERVGLGALGGIALCNLCLLGTKETFVLAGLLPLAFAACRIRRGGAGQRGRMLVFLAVVLVSDLYVLWGIGATLAAKGADVHGRAMDWRAFFDDIHLDVRTFAALAGLQWYVAAAAGLLGLNAWIGAAGGLGRPAGNKSLGFCAMAAFVFLFGLSQFVFYDGQVGNQHYAVPFSMIPAMLWLVLGWFALATAARLPWLGPARAARLAVALACAYCFVVTPSFSRDLVRILVDTNRGYQGRLAGIAARLAAEPGRPLLLVAGAGENDELVVSPAVYLKKVFHVPNAIHVAVTAAPGAPEAGPSPVSQLARNGYVDSIAAGEAPGGAAGLRLGITSAPPGEAGNLGQLFPLAAADPTLKLHPVFSRNIR
ncbi:MAG: hypothetical protein ACP59X_19535 [Solidesulfovibrio sp. DCME]|uniref:hypothetical protein n=1 Tax=Solidesulfovibrio sp. DCME TaxID=3447380 RepID=UPI003D130BE9